MISLFYSTCFLRSSDRLNQECVFCKICITSFGVYTECKIHDKKTMEREILRKTVPFIRERMS